MKSTKTIENPITLSLDSTVTDQIESSVHTVNTSTLNNEDSSISASTTKTRSGVHRSGIYLGCETTDRSSVKMYLVRSR